MKILLISDLHSQKIAKISLEKFLSRDCFDLVVSCGDIAEKTNLSPDYFNEVLNIFDKYQVKFLGIPGNNDSKELFLEMVKKGISIHLAPKNIGKYKFTGLGGWGYDVENEFSVEDHQKDLKIDKNTIFVSHIPPDIKTVKLLKNKPLIHICGHRHNIAKTRIIDGMLLIQVPALMFGRAAILELPSKKLKFIG